MKKFKVTYPVSSVVQYPDSVSSFKIDEYVIIDADYFAIDENGVLHLRKDEQPGCDDLLELAAFKEWSNIQEYNPEIDE